jgi:TolA-binding protein
MVCSLPPARRSAGALALCLLCAGLALLSTAPASAQPPDQQAEMILTSARKAYNEQNYSFAAARFRELLQKFGGHPKANDARYGLGLSLLDGPERNFEQAIEPLAQLAGNQGFAERPYVLYHLGLAQRGAGVNDLAQAIAKPQEAQQHRGRAEGRFNEAARNFGEAVKAFAAKVGKVDPNAKELPTELEWLGRARCDQAEMELRLNRAKEARATSEPFLNDPLLAKNRYRPLGLYYHGFASFLLGDYLVAGRSLNQLAPFNDPHYGLHAHYLMGRIYQLSGEQAEAATMYEGVLADFDKQKKDAAEALKRPDQFKNNPAERVRLENLVKNPPPEAVAGAVFHSGCLQYEAGKFGEALARFQQFAKDFPQSSLVPEATLRIGYAQVQVKQFDEAVKTLQPLVEKQPRLADQALLWIGKAQAGMALAIDPAKVQERENGLKTAIATLRSAADRANQLAANDPEAKQRRGEILLELSDIQQTARQGKDAAATLEQALNEKLLPNRAEELTQRLATALHIAGDYARSDQVCTRFQQEFPKSTLLAPVLFRMAENAYFVALAAEKNPNLPNRTAELARLYDEAGKRYKAIVDRFPEFERVHVARFGLAMCHLQRQEFDKAQEVLEAIPAAERNGDLGQSSYLLAECLLRAAPAKADDALAAGMLLEKLQQAQQHLEGFIAANPGAPELPDAMLKLGYCLTRLALNSAQPQERANGLNQARQVYEKLIQQFPKEPQMAAAVMERAKCIAHQGDKNGAVNELRRFANDPLQQSPVAPTALLNLATLLREQNKAEEAAQMLAAARQRHEPSLGKEPEKIALLRYHHGVCLQEAGKFAEARQQLDSVQQVLPNHPLTAEAALRSGQCRIVEGKRTVEMARQQLGNAGSKPEQQAAANNLLQTGFNTLNEAAGALERKAEELRQALPTADARARMYYDAAWAYRTIADNEVSKARAAKLAELQKKVEEAKKSNSAKPSGGTPEVARAEIPLQPAETKARYAYQNLIGNFGDIELALEARFELAELFAERDEFEPAVKLLREALDKEPADKPPPAQLLEKVRIRLGVCLAANKDTDAALTQFEVVANNPKSPLAAQALYRAGECLLHKGDFAKAAEKLKAFRDKPELQNVAGVTDRALLCLGRAYSQAKQWEPARQAYETLIGRFGGSPYVSEARYGIGWALQNAGQFDPAVNTYQQVIAQTASELAAKAHLQIGLCRLEQKRWAEASAALLIVPFTFDYPDLNAVALCEAARALTEEKKPEQAERLLRRVVKDYPQSEWAKVAQQRLDALKK